MAKSAAYRWQNERRRGLLGKPKPTKSRKVGISPKQAKYLAALQRKLREPYSGDGMTRAEASKAIDDCKRRLKVKSPAEARPTPVSRPKEKGGATRG